jgi:asparagine synthase (glutamine-hydrolysing)
VRDAILGARLADTGWFDMRALRRIVEAHETGACDHSAALWSLLMLEAFLRSSVNAGQATDQVMAAV